MDLIILQECPHFICSRAHDLWLRSQGRSQNSFCILFFHTVHAVAINIFGIHHAQGNKPKPSVLQHFLMVVVISRKKFLFHEDKLTKE